MVEKADDKAAKLAEIIALKAKRKKAREANKNKRARTRDPMPAGHHMQAVVDAIGPDDEGVQTHSPGVGHNGGPEFDDDEEAEFAASKANAIIMAAILTGKEPPAPSVRLKPGATMQQRKAALIERVATSGDEVNGAAKALGIDRTIVWDWRRTDKAFSEALEYAYQIDGTSALVSVAVRRAVHGWLEPVYNKGILCGFVRKYDHTLLMRLIQKRDPAYKDPKYVMQTEAPKRPGEVTVDLDAATPTEREVLRKMAERQAKRGQGR